MGRHKEKHVGERGDHEDSLNQGYRQRAQSSKHDIEEEDLLEAFKPKHETRLTRSATVRRRHESENERARERGILIRG
jgi:hypothetical protein